MAIQDCLHNARLAGDITAQEEAELLQRLKEIERDGLRGAQTKAHLEKELRAEAVERKRVQLLQASAVSQIAARARAEGAELAAAGRKPDIARTFFSVFENIGNMGGQSIRGRQQALFGEALAGMSDMLHAFRRSGLTLKRFAMPLADDMVRAAFGENVSGEAQAFHRAFMAAAEKLRALYNEAGGHIGWRDDWGLPQFHAADALAAAGFDKWAEFILPRLDWEKMSHAVSGLSILPEERMDVLRHVFDSIVMDGWNKREPSRTGQGGIGGSFASRRADPRFLVFKDAASWLDYNRSYGTGEVFTSMMKHLRSMARDVGMMQTLGPNPGATVSWMKQVVAQEAAKARVGRDSLFRESVLGGNRLTMSEAQRTLDGFHEVARGAFNPSSPVGDSIGIFRNLQYGAKLGGAVIVHAMGNPVIQMGARYMHGLPVMKALPEILAQIGGDARELAQAGHILQDATTFLDKGAREQGMLRRTRELSSWLPAVTTHFSGLEAIVEAHRRAGFLSQMATWANHLDKDFGALDPRLRDTLKGNGLTEKDWAIIRQARPSGGDRTAPFLSFDDIAHAPGVDSAAAADVARKYLTMLHQVGEALTPSSNWWIKAKTARLGGEGTATGELARSALMFKGGFMATLMLTQARLIARQAASGRAVAPYIGAMTIGMTLAGMATLQLKQLRAGKDLMNMDPTHKEGLETWAHAFLTSGALGLMGDFIHSESSSYGHGFISSSLGPVVTGAEDAFGAAAKALGGKGPWLDPGAGGVKYLRNNTALLSTHWATQAAYNRIVLDQLQFLTDPKAHQRMRAREQKLRHDTHQGYWWGQGDMAPHRLPEVAR